MSGPARRPVVAGARRGPCHARPTGGWCDDPADPRRDPAPSLARGRPRILLGGRAPAVRRRATGTPGRERPDAATAGCAPVPGGVAAASAGASSSATRPDRVGHDLGRPAAELPGFAGACRPRRGSGPPAGSLPVGAAASAGYVWSGARSAGLPTRDDRGPARRIGSLRSSLRATRPAGPGRVAPLRGRRTSSSCRAGCPFRVKDSARTGHTQVDGVDASMLARSASGIDRHGRGSARQASSRPRDVGPLVLVEWACSAILRGVRRGVGAPPRAPDQSYSRSRCHVPSTRSRYTSASQWWPTTLK